VIRRDDQAAVLRNILQTGELNFPTNTTDTADDRPYDFQKPLREHSPATVWL